MPLFGKLLPRHMEIVNEINRRFVESVRRRYPGDDARVSRMSLIDEAGSRRVRMAHLACVGSHATNGVAALHTELLTREVLRDFWEMFPERFSNKTNGVTPRRFLALANPALSALISEAIGEGWVKDLEQLRGLEPWAEDAEFRRRWRKVKMANKQRLAAWLASRAGVALDPWWIFDVHVKRFHEYKRQHLNILHVISLYQRLKREPGLDVPPRLFIFGGKSAPGYDLAKRIIRLVNGVAEVVNADPEVNGKLGVAFIPNFNVQNAELVYPAADISEQISTAGKEASGTGNMKFALNGALTIGTLDGANVEIRAAVGEENFFLFGMTAEEVERLRASGYQPQGYVERDPRLRDALALVASGHFSRGDASTFAPLVGSLLGRDEYFVLADFAAYAECHERIVREWLDKELWTRSSILNTARMGRFSSDRAIREYCEDIWRVSPVPVRSG